jgi:hypothetical protein
MCQLFESKVERGIHNNKASYFSLVTSNRQTSIKKMTTNNTLDEGVSWMYKDPKKYVQESKSTIDEYLLGNKKIDDVIIEHDYDRMKKANVPGALFIQKNHAHKKTNHETVMQIAREDPFVAMKALELKALKAKLQDKELLEKMKKKQEKKQRKEEAERGTEEAQTRGRTRR